MDLQQDTDEKLAAAARAMQPDEPGGTSLYDKVTHYCLAAIGAAMSDHADKHAHVRRLMEAVLACRKTGFLGACNALGARATAVLPPQSEIRINVDLDKIEPSVREHYRVALPIGHEILSGFANREVGRAATAMQARPLERPDVALALLLLLVTFAADQYTGLLAPITEAWDAERPR